MRLLWQKYQPHLETLFVFGLAASVRLTSLGVFRAVDEEDRWAWAVDFYRALLAGDLAGTLIGDGYPGIFPAWLETIWLLLVSLYRSALQGGWIGDDGVYLLIHEWGRQSHLAQQRLPVVLANTLLVVVIFLYVRRLFGRRVALLAGVLISLDPFYLSDSRVNRAEALLTGLMTVSLLALIAAYRRSNRRQLIASAIFGGLAWLTKSQALVMLPMFGVISLVWSLRAEADPPAGLRRWLVTMLAWTLLAAATFVLLWPATWTTPGPTFGLMADYATRKVGAEGVKLFFLGRTVLDEDPGQLFYPVIFLLRVTPLVLFGLLLGGWQLIRWVGARGRPTAASWRSWLDDGGVWALLAYVLLYVGGMSLGSHKQDRFLMAAFPVFGLLAALAIDRLAGSRGWSPRRTLAAGGALLALQLATALPFHPYYYTYFNPLVGGGPVAARLTRIGWGEGMDQVADYLSSREDGDTLTVATRFNRYLLGFQGEVMNFGQDGDWVRADKVVLYIQQVQRMLEPSPGVIRYFLERQSPEKVVRIDGINYAWVYQNPIAYPADPLRDRAEGRLALFGYSWEAPVVRLFWENQGGDGDGVAVRLWATADLHGDWLPCAPAPGFEEAAHTPGEVVESECRLSPEGLTPGLYDLQVGLSEPDRTWLPLEFAAGWSAVEMTPAGSLNRVSAEVAFARLADEAVPASATPLEHTYAHRVRLLAYELAPARLQPGQSAALALYWQALRQLEGDAHVTIQAFAGQDERVVHLNGPPLGGARPTRTWRPGEVIRDEWTVTLPPDLPAPALVRLDVGLFLPETLQPLQVRNLAGQDIPGAITHLRLEPAAWPAYSGDRPLDVTFGEAIHLSGFELTSPPPGEVIELTLYWAALAPLQDDYTAFVHLLNGDGTLAAQSDVPPGQGYYPTSAWQPGQMVLSRHRLELPPDLLPGRYTLLAGLYRAADGARLPITNPAGDNPPDDVAPLGQISLP